MHKKGLYEKHLKRLMDFSLSFIAIIILSPLLGIVAILVRIKLGAPIIFKQLRPGKNEKVFFLYKFRTMTNCTNDKGELLPDSDRITKFGIFLRKTSLDELPGIFNIIKGDLSIVGPRPLLVKYLPLYSDEQRRRHEVRPGLTGLAQINGRNSISWEQKFQYDIEYINNVNFLYDIKIIFKTIIKVLKHEGITSNSSMTAEEFRGNNQ